MTLVDGSILEPVTPDSPPGASSSSSSGSAEVPRDDAEQLVVWQKPALSDRRNLPDWDDVFDDDGKVIPDSPVGSRTFALSSAVVMCLLLSFLIRLYCWLASLQDLVDFNWALTMLGGRLDVSF